MRSLDFEKIFESMKKNDINEVIIKEGRESIELRRGGFANNAPQATVAPVVAAAPVTVNPVVATPSAAVAPSQAVPVAPAKSNYYEVKSPLVGTFYSSSKPGSPAFVEVGVKVKNGQKLCIVEAMKNFNEIESDVNGVIKEVLLKDGDLVEYGKVLFRIEQE